MRSIRRLGTTLVVLPALLAAPMTLYLAVLTAVGLRRGRPSDGDEVAGGDDTARTRFVVFVPAHNEAGGIGATLDSLAASNYPPDRFAVHVVADNCSDETAEVVRRHGVEVHERVAADDPGKGPALNWLFDRMVAAGVEFDAVVIIDADTIVAPEFLHAMDGAIDSGAAAAQGFYTVREPEASSATSLRYAALACRHHLRAQARCRLGASCGLYGNGMAFRREVLAARRWSGHLVEDAEFQIDLLLDGCRVVYVPGAVVLAEMPVTLEQSVTQNKRWERGRLELMKRSVPDLVRRMRHAGSGSRIALGDAVLDQVTPPISVIGAFHGLACVGAGVGAVLRIPRSRTMLVLHLFGLTVVAAHIVAGLVSIRAGARHYLALASAPRAMIWKLRLWLSVLGSSRTVSWERTQRNQEVNGEEMS